MDFTLFYSFIFLFGLVVGSFLNVVIYRTETNEDIVFGRSCCRQCHRILAWYDLVPLLSFLALRGKCRYCRQLISAQYPLVELLTGIMFVLIAWRLGFVRDLEFGIGNFFIINYYWFIVSTLIIIFVYDLKHYIIPDKVVYAAILVSGIWYSVFGFFLNFYTKYEILYTLLAALLAGGFFLIIVLLTKGEGMGGGDIKLAFLMGLFLGTEKILTALVLAFTLGAFWGIILILLKKKTLKSAIPFGPFLVIGTLAALFLQW